MNAAVDVFKRNEFQGSSLDALNAWVAEVAALTQPDHIYWCDGSDAENARLTQQDRKSTRLNSSHT